MTFALRRDGLRSEPDLLATISRLAQQERTSTTALVAALAPAAVRRAVWARDDGRCTFVGTEGRCGETGFLELHHLEPYALGGATTIEGMALRCRAHNTYEAQREFKVLELDRRNPRARYEPGSAASS